MCGTLDPANVPIEGWIIDPDVHGLLDGPSDLVYLLYPLWRTCPFSVMICGVGMTIDGGRGPEMFLEPFPKDPLQILTCTHHSPTCQPCICR